MTRTQKIVIAALAAIAAAIILVWTPAQETWGQDNTPRANTAPVITAPESISLDYLFPRGEKAVLKFPSEPVTDAEGDTATVRFEFTVPDGDDTTKTGPMGALFKVTTKGEAHNFEFTAKDMFTQQDFTDLYGNVVSYPIPVKMYANDGTQDSLPLSFTITAYHDASAQFNHAAAYKSEQRWELNDAIEVYEGPQANDELGAIILGAGGLPARISGTTDALQVPWSSTVEGARTWTLGHRDSTENSPKIKCGGHQSGETTLTWDEAGSKDSALFEIDQPEGDQQQGHIPIRFVTSAPDYEDAKDQDTDNEYLIRLVNSHDIHGLDGEPPPLGCDGSAVDLKIKVKDVGPPAPPTGLILTLETNTQDEFGIYWDHPHPNKFIENGNPVPFPHPSFNADALLISHEPEGLQFPIINPGSTLSIPTNIGGIENIRGTPGVTYTITIRLRNSEGLSAPVSEQITPLGPPAVPEAPAVKPESDTSVTATWKKPDNNGGQPITGYEVQYQKEGEGEWKTQTHTGTGTSAIIKDLDETSVYHVQVKAKNNLGASEWSPSGTGSTAGLVVQIASGGDITSGNDAVFTVTLSKAATVTVNFTHAWTGGYGDSTAGTVGFTDEDSKTYALSTTSPDNPEEDGGSVTVTIDTDAAYAIGTNGSATVNIVNEPPAFAAETAARSVAENTAAGQSIGLPVTATDPDTDDTLTHTLEGADSDSFDIDSASGQIQTKSGVTYDHEVKSSYSVTVKADDNNGGAATVDVTITVTNVNEPPEFDSATATREVPENTAADEDIDDPVTATDPDAGDTMTYTLGGTDAASFDIDASTGQLQTKAALDHETKNSYTVTVTASDGALTAAVDVTVTVTNIDEAGTVTLSTDQPAARAEITAVLTDPDGGVAGAVWQWEKSGDGNTAWAETGTGSSSYTPVDEEVGHHLRAAASYTDGHGPDKTAQAASTQAVQAGANRPPEFDSATAAREVPENTEAGENIGTPVTATDPDTGDTLTYTLGGDDDASFSIVAGSGQLQTKADLDYETKPRYEVTVTATDSSGSSDASGAIDVTITVTDVNEPPAFAGETATRTIAENTEADVDIGTPVLATDPDAETTLTYGLAETDAASFRINESTGQLRTKAALDFEDKASYTVTVSVRDSKDTSGNTDTETDDTIAVTITIADVNEPPSASGPASVSYEENRTDAVATYTASDPEGATITWALSGDDAADFAINGGALTFKTSPDYEDAADANTDNVYLATVEAADGSLKSTLDVRVTVTGVNEAPEFPATETGARAIAENAEAGQPIGDPAEAEDPDAGDSLTYTLGGADADSFSIVATSGQLGTKAALDHETKASYTVTVSVRDSKDASGDADTATDATVTITITVTNVNEPPEFSSTETGARSVAENTPAGQDIGLPVSATGPGGRHADLQPRRNRCGLLRRRHNVRPATDQSRLGL